jgi:hypothetical protein
VSSSIFATATSSAPLFSPPSSAPRVLAFVAPTSVAGSSAGAGSGSGSAATKLESSPCSFTFSASAAASPAQLPSRVSHSSTSIEPSPIDHIVAKGRLGFVRFLGLSLACLGKLHADAPCHENKNAPTCSRVPSASIACIISSIDINLDPGGIFFGFRLGRAWSAVASSFGLSIPEGHQVDTIQHINLTVGQAAAI